MKRFLLFTAAAVLFIGFVFMVLVQSSSSVSHLHFTTRGGVLKNVVYYSPQAPETAAEHRCDGEFSEVLDHLYDTHLELWRKKYQER